MALRSAAPTPHNLLWDWGGFLAHWQRSAAMGRSRQRIEREDQLRGVLSNLLDPGVKLQWDEFSKSYNRYTVICMLNNREENARSYQKIVDKVAAGQRNALWQYRKSYDIVLDPNRNSARQNKHEMALLRDDIDLQTWNIARDILDELREAFLQDVRDFVGLFSEQYKERITHQILPLINRLDDYRGEFVIQNVVHVLYIVIDLQIYE